MWFGTVSRGTQGSGTSGHTTSKFQKTLKEKCRVNGLGPTELSVVEVRREVLSNER